MLQMEVRVSSYESLSQNLSGGAEKREQKKSSLRSAGPWTEIIAQGSIYKVTESANTMWTLHTLWSKY
jgi:hypothetical protein